MRCGAEVSGSRIRTITKNLDREVAKEKITAEDKTATLKRIQTVTDRGKLAGCAFVIEAATEKFEIKTEIFRDLDRVIAPDAILWRRTHRPSPSPSWPR